MVFRFRLTIIMSSKNECFYKFHTNKRARLEPRLRTFPFDDVIKNTGLPSTPASTFQKNRRPRKVWYVCLHTLELYVNSSIAKFKNFLVPSFFFLLLRSFLHYYFCDKDEAPILQSLSRSFIGA